jgi:hypothetical protein
MEHADATKNPDAAYGCVVAAGALSKEKGAGKRPSKFRMLLLQQILTEQLTF